MNFNLVSWFQNIIILLLKFKFCFNLIPRFQDYMDNVDFYLNTHYHSFVLMFIN